MSLEPSLSELPTILPTFVISILYAHFPARRRGSGLIISTRRFFPPLLFSPRSSKLSLPTSSGKPRSSQKLEKDMHGPYLSLLSNVSPPSFASFESRPPIPFDRFLHPQPLPILISSLFCCVIFSSQSSGSVSFSGSSTETRNVDCKTLATTTKSWPTTRTTELRVAKRTRRRIWISSLLRRLTRRGAGRWFRGSTMEVEEEVRGR